MRKSVLVTSFLGALAVSMLAATPASAQFVQSRLLYPFVTNQAGFDTGISVSNTGLDSTGTPGQAGRCTVYYFGQITGGVPAVVAPQTTNAPIPPGGQLVFTLSTGGSFGIAGAPGFQGYIEVTCEFRFAHGLGLLTDVGVRSVASTIPALVLPVGTRQHPEGLGQ